VVWPSPGVTRGVPVPTGWVGHSAVYAYAAMVGGRLRDVLGPDLVGVYLHGSAVLGGWHPHVNDVDLLAVVVGPLEQAAKTAVAGRLIEPTPPCPAARGLDLHVVAAAAVRAPTRSPSFKLHVGFAPGTDRHAPGFPVNVPTTRVVDGSGTAGDPDTPRSGWVIGVLAAPVSNGDGTRPFVCVVYLSVRPIDLPVAGTVVLRSGPMDGSSAPADTTAWCYRATDRYPVSCRFTSIADVTYGNPRPRQGFTDKLAKWVAIIGGIVAICAAVGIPTQLGAFGNFRIPGLPGRDVAAAISLSKGQGRSGTQLTVSGTGFSGGEIVDVRFHTEKIGEAQVGDDGSFSTDVTIPGSFDAFGGGHNYDISATGRESIKHASQPFKLLGGGGGGPNTGPASISLSDGSGPSGTELTVSGENFQPGEEVKISFATTEMGRAVADNDGRFELSVTIPGNQDAFGSHQVDIAANGQQSIKHADAPFQLTV